MPAAVGTGIYTVDSHIGIAAIHDNLITSNFNWSHSVFQDIFADDTVQIVFTFFARWRWKGQSF